MNEQKIVDFEEYCKRCKYYEKPEHEDPCWDCLDYPVNAWTHKPMRFEERENKK